MSWLLAQLIATDNVYGPLHLTAKVARGFKKELHVADEHSRLLLLQRAREALGAYHQRQFSKENLRFELLHFEAAMLDEGSTDLLHLLSGVARRAIELAAGQSGDTISHDHETVLGATQLAISLIPRTGRPADHSRREVNRLLAWAWYEIVGECPGFTGNDFNRSKTSTGPFARYVQASWQLYPGNIPTAAVSRRGVEWATQDFRKWPRRPDDSSWRAAVL